MKRITDAIILAAGRGLRAGEGDAKQWRALAGARVIDHAVAAFAGHPAVRRLVVVTPDGEAHDLGVETVAGGRTRSDSVRAGLEAIAGDPPDYVLIHDGARPVVPGELIDRVLAALDEHAGAAPGLQVTDTLWRGNDGFVSGAQARDGLFRAQTPQGFRFDLIRQAHADAPEATDDVAVFCAAGNDVRIVAGAGENLKITYPDDFKRAETSLAGPPDIRMGQGYDVHAFGPGDHVTLCGVDIEHDFGLAGHSDADVAMHAVTDALLGAVAEGDIGRHFPPSDDQWKGAPSDIFLARAVEIVTTRGFSIGNVDCTIICERPKIGPHAEAMQGCLAEILGIEAGRVSVKATTSERLGFTGREEGIAAMAIATVIGR